MTTKTGNFICEITSSTRSLDEEEEEEFLTYGVRVVTQDDKIIYEFEDISPDRERVEGFVTRLNSEHTPVTHLHFAVMDFLQAM